MKDKILKQFDENNSLYTSYGEKCKGIILELINDNSIPILQINSRTKERESLEKKIDTKKDKYSDLSEITDVSGIRVITYLDSDVNKVAEIIENEFQIDTINSIDKRKLKSDQFGYMSLHYVVSLNPQRQAITENKKYSGLKVEIQIRSILQHAWAEIEHDLGYKGKLAIPENLKRSFNRLAALLETADIEFNRLKKDLTEYEVNVTKDIKTQPDEVLIDQASISSFTKSFKTFNKAGIIIQKNTGCIFFDKTDFKGELERFELFKIKTIGEFERLILKDEKHYLSFVNLYTKDMREEKLPSSLPLFYFQHFLAAKSESEKYVNEYFNYGSYTFIAGVRSAKSFIDTYNNSK
jgi:ppGpp synthetase/RelA/SpoT-type nucleotidyltranferase